MPGGKVGKGALQKKRLKSQLRYAERDLGPPAVARNLELLNASNLGDCRISVQFAQGVQKEIEKLRAGEFPMGDVSKQIGNRSI